MLHIPGGNRKSHVRVQTIGHIGHGKTTLMKAITSVLSKQLAGKAFAYSEVDGPVEHFYRGVSFNAASVEYDIATCYYAVLDCQSHDDHIKSLIAGASGAEIVIFVCSVVDGLTPQAREQLLVARQSGISRVIVFLNKCDLFDDEEVLALMEDEFRTLIAESGLLNENISFVRGAASLALAGDVGPLGESAIINLVDELGVKGAASYRGAEESFIMPVEDVFAISGRGVVVTGCIERGRIKVGDEVEVVGLKMTTKTTCSGVENSRPHLNEFTKGFNTGILLRGLAKNDVQRGQVIAKPGSIFAYNGFNARVYFLSLEERGRVAPIFSGHRPQFYFRTIVIGGSLDLLDGKEMASCGETAYVRVKLTASVVMEVGFRFAILEDSRTIAIGVVTEILDEFA